MATPDRVPLLLDDLEQFVAMLDGPAGALASVWAARHLDAPIPATQLRVLFVVERHGTVNVTGVAEEIGALLSSASRLCARLESTGLLERTPGPDRRAITLRLTPEGARLLEGLREARRRDLKEVLAAMDPSARAALLVGLQQFQQVAGRRESVSTVDFSMPA
ncbi:MarR family transcriptional regulator [Spirillospora sp. NPDC049652]